MIWIGAFFNLQHHDLTSRRHYHYPKMGQDVFEVKHSETPTVIHIYVCGTGGLKILKGLEAKNNIGMQPSRTWGVS